jgi:hypothetical protein
MPGNPKPSHKYKRKVLRVEDLSDTELAAIAAVAPPAWTRRFDYELDPDARECSLLV